MNEQRIGPELEGDDGISCSVSSPSLAPQRGIRGFIDYLISCCPYTMLGKKIVKFLRGEIGTPYETLTNRELYLQRQIKTGFGIFLIGVFCPIFWLSFFSGVREKELIFNAVHSLIVILFGLAYMVTYRIRLRKELTKMKQ